MSATLSFDEVLWREIAQYMPPISVARLTISAKSTFKEAIYGIQSMVRVEHDSADVRSVLSEPFTALLNAITAKPHYSLLQKIFLGSMNLKVLTSTLERCRALPHLRYLSFIGEMFVSSDITMEQFDAVWTNGGWRTLQALDIRTILPFDGTDRKFTLKPLRIRKSPYPIYKSLLAIRAFL
eukprot:TRINITY_DN2492_c0_g1_i4.p1 TRINITY_DN2492_c0_g1~~TRINITY_DN2492_c0_g1_i4.p1  ORF type:complete len:181 (+),score=8.76 TRINITY_DN2492_c0_g1_i4:94-636(+)